MLLYNFRIISELNKHGHHQVMKFEAWKNFPRLSDFVKYSRTRLVRTPRE